MNPIEHTSGGIARDDGNGTLIACKGNDARDYQVDLGLITGMNYTKFEITMRINSAGIVYGRKYLEFVCCCYVEFENFSKQFNGGRLIIKHKLI